MSGDVLVNAYSTRDNSFNSAEVARVAAESLTVFESRFGLYPYRELDIQLIPFAYTGGDEYPGLIFLYLDRPVDTGTLFVTAHEVAHQWWYGLVGNDIYKEPWLDEAFAQYSAYVYIEDMYDKSKAETEWAREIERRYQAALDEGNLPVSWPINRYNTFNQYYRTIYGKGPVFLHRLRQTVGDDVFFQGVSKYFERNRYGVGSSADFQQAIEETSGRDHDEFFQLWLGT